MKYTELSGRKYDSRFFIAFLWNHLTTDVITQDIKGFGTNVSLSNRVCIYSRTELQEYQDTSTCHS